MLAIQEQPRCQHVISEKKDCPPVRCNGPMLPCMDGQVISQATTVNTTYWQCQWDDKHWVGRKVIR